MKTTCFKRPVLWGTLLALLIFAGACNLAIDLEKYPYPLPYEGGDGDFDGDVGPGDEDVDEVPLPRGSGLLITELMIRPSPLPETSQKWGEYIEIYNAGDRTVHPRNLVIELVELNDRIYIDRLVSSPQEQEAVAALQPIEPGEFFIFLHRDAPFYGITDGLREGSFYEYGRWHRPISLSNNTATLRLLEIRGDFDVVVHQEVGWEGGFLIDLDGNSTTRLDIRQDIAFGLRRHVVDPDEARSPDNWCYHLQRFSEGPLLGSPGRRTPETCL